MTLSARLNLLIGALLSIALIALAALLFIRGLSRVQAEEQAMLRAAEFIVHAAVPRIAESSDPDREIAAVLAQLRGLKHISIWPVYQHAARPSPVRYDRDDLFQRLAKAIVGDGRDRIHTRIPLGNAKADIMAIEMSPNPADEMEEIVREVFDILVISALFSCFVFIITRQLVQHALKPLSELQAAVSDLRSGNYNVSVSPNKSPEFASISHALTDLGNALKRAQERSQKLAAQLVSAQDRERKDIARELHDELGANLFAIRAQAATLQVQISEDKTSSVDKSGAMCALIAQCNALQSAHRRVLQRLAPPGLQELGLKKSLYGLVENWRAQHADKEFTGRVDVPDNLSETVTLTIYRIVQEGVTNVLKHADATKISIMANVEDPSGASPHKILKVQIIDNGHGAEWEIVPGFGLKSMNERVTAIGGELTISDALHGGICLEAVVPLPDYGPRVDPGLMPVDR